MNFPLCLHRKIKFKENTQEIYKRKKYEMHLENLH